MPKGSHADDGDATHHISNFFSNQLQDGFHEIFSFQGHRLQLRGLKMVEWMEDNRRQAGFYQRQFFISWDVKQVLLWRQDFLDSQSEPQPHPVLINQVRFSNQPNFICAIVHIPKLKVFLAAALDMSFKLFDKALGMLESIRHEERAILQIEHDNSKDIIFTSGATGVSAWKLYRNTSLDKAHVMEKLYSFKGCADWITHMIYEPQFNRIYALKECSAQVLSIPRRCVVTALEDCHEAPINVVCWYERNQFYITGCSRGEIKCWTSNYSHSGLKKGPGTAVGNENSSSKVFALLHAFQGHTKAVTGIRLHPISGLAISAGLDGFVKVLNLEALNELFSIKLDNGVLSMQIIRMGSHGFGCLMSFVDASIKMWKITSVCDFFATSSSSISSLESFENLEAELEHFHRLKHHADLPQTQQPAHEGAVVEENGLPHVADQDETHDDPAVEETAEESQNHAGGGGVNDRILVTFSSQDLRCFTHMGSLMGRLEPEHIVDGIRAFTVSVYQKLLFCLCERDRIRVHCLRRFALPLVFEFSLQGCKAVSSNPNHSEEEGNKGNQAREDMGTCCALIDVAPANAMRVPKATSSSIITSGGGLAQSYAISHREGESNVDYKKDARGQHVPDYIESYLLVGLNTGAILFLDTLNNFEVQMNFQAHNGSVQEIKYRRRLRELLVLGRDFSETYSTVRIWRLPDMELMAEVGELKKVTCFSISLSLSHFAVGTASGTVRLFTVDVMDKNIKEINRVSESHDAKVNSICFCDDMRVICSCSEDSKVKFWDFGKRLVRTIQLNSPTCGVVQNGGPGDVLMAQNHYLLTIPTRIWDEGDLTADMKKQVENAETERNANAHMLAVAAANAATAVAATVLVDPVGSSTKKPIAMIEVVEAAMEAEKGMTPHAMDETKSFDDDKSHVTPTTITPTGRRGSRRSSRRTLKGSAALFAAEDPAIEASKKLPERRKDTILLSNQSDTSEGSRATMSMAEDLEEKVLLPHLEATQFQFLSPTRSRSPSPTAHRLTFDIQQDDSAVFASDSVYSRMQQYSGTLAAPTQHRPSAPFVFDVLHPRFLIHKKPAARAVQLEDLEQHFGDYLAKLNAVKASEAQNAELLNAYAKHKQPVKPIVEDQQPMTRRPAQFGLSPRARLTLLSSHPSSAPSGNHDGNVEVMTNAMHAAHLARTHENIICSAALGMKVSESYRKHREVLNQARHERLHDMSKRASVSMIGTDKSNWLEKLKEKQIQAKMLMEGVDESSDADDTSLNGGLSSNDTTIKASPNPRRERKSVVSFSGSTEDHMSPMPPASSKPVEVIRRKPIKPVSKKL